MAHCLSWVDEGLLVGGLTVWAQVVCGLLNLVSIVVVLGMEVFPRFCYLWLLGLYSLEFVFKFWTH